VVSDLPEIERESFMSWRLFLLVCACLGVDSAIASAQADTLPAGAILRFGSTPKKDAPSPINEVSFSPDGNLVLSSDTDSVCVWGIASGARLRKIDAATTGLHFTTDGRSLVAGYKSGIYTWKVATGMATRIFKDESGSGYAPLLCIDSKGNRLAAIHSMRVSVHSLPTGEEIRTIVSLEDERFSDLSFVDLAFSPDGQYLATSQRVQTQGKKQWPIFLWEVNTGNLIRKFGPSTDDFNSLIRFAADGSVYCVYKHQIQQWNSTTGKLVRQYQAHAADTPATTVFTTSADGKLLAHAANGQIKIHETISGKHRQTIERHAAALAFSPNGQSLLVGESDGTLMLWRVNSK
jgi:WD40 repeat protein